MYKMYYLSALSLLPGRQGERQPGGDKATLQELAIFSEHGALSCNLVTEIVPERASSGLILAHLQILPREN
jgi:hypothetical protein